MPTPKKNNPNNPNKLAEAVNKQVMPNLMNSLSNFIFQHSNPFNLRNAQASQPEMGLVSSPQSGSKLTEQMAVTQNSSLPQFQKETSSRLAEQQSAEKVSGLDSILAGELSGKPDSRIQKAIGNQPTFGETGVGKGLNKAGNGLVDFFQSLGYGFLGKPLSQETEPSVWDYAGNILGRFAVSDLSSGVISNPSIYDQQASQRAYMAERANLPFELEKAEKMKQIELAASQQKKRSDIQAGQMMLDSGNRMETSAFGGSELKPFESAEEARAWALKYAKDTDTDPENYLSYADAFPSDPGTAKKMKAKSTAKTVSILDEAKQKIQKQSKYQIVTNKE